MNGGLNRLDQLEARFERLRLDLQDTQRKLTQALQQIRDGQAKYVAPGGGNGTVYVALTGSGGIPAASSTPAGGTPGSVSGLSVYQISGGSYNLVSTSATVYNPYLSATASAAKVVTVSPNGDGTYTLLGESCA